MLSDQWKEMSQKLYSQQPLANRHRLVEELSLDPLGLPSPDKKSPWLWPSPENSSFWSINLGQGEILTEEFLKRREAALFLNRNLNLTDDLRASKFYFASSADLCSVKKDFLTRYEKQKINVHLGIDPYSLGLWQSLVFKSAPDLSFLEMENVSTFFRLTSLPYNLAGAGEIHEMAILLSGIVQLMEDYEGFLSPAQILSSTSFELAMDPNFFVGIAKIQALQLLTAKIQEVESVEGALPPIFCVASPRFLSRREPWNNIMRLVTVNMAARVGGAKGLIHLPYDLFSNADGTRISRNMDLILQEESYLNRVQQATLGSHTVDTFVDKLCEKAWVFFQEIQSKGGLKTSLRSGWLQDEIERCESEQKKKFKKREMKIVGVNDFVLSQASDSNYPLAQPDQVLDAENWWLSFQMENTAEKLFEVEKITPSLLAEKFERRQFFADGLRKKSPQHVRFQLVQEPGFDATKKVATVKKVLGLLGLDLCEEGPAHLGVVVVAADPEGEFSRSYIEKHQGSDKSGLLLWGGEKLFPHFDDFVGVASDLDTLFSTIQRYCKETM